MAPSPATIDLLLSHAGWLRAIARDLVRGEDRADEVFQEAWLYALEHPPRHHGNLRSWLGGVARNVVRQARRGEGRRGRRERSAARREAVPDPADAVARVELRQRIAAAVLALPEPTRTAVVLKYFEEVESVDIAARLGVPDSTVRSRIHRGLAMLRRRLDRDHGESRSAWCAVLLPLLEPRTAGTATGALGGIGAAITGVLIMSTKAKITVCVAAVLGLSVAAWQLSGPSAEPPPLPAAPAVGAVPAGGTADSRSTAEAAAGAEMRAPPPSRTVREGGVISGRAVRSDGRPAAGILLGCYLKETAFSVAHRSALVRTGPEGRFSFPVVRGAPYRVSTYRMGYGAVSKEVVGGETDILLTVPVVSRLVISAVDADSGETFRVRSAFARWRQDGRNRSAWSWPRYFERHPELLSADEEDLRGLPTPLRLPILLPGPGSVTGEITLKLEAEGYEPHTVRIDARDLAEDLGERRFVMRKITPGSWTLEVTVSKEDGTPFVGRGEVSVFRGEVEVHRAWIGFSRGKGIVEGLPLGADRARVEIAGGVEEIGPCPSRDGEIRDLEMVLSRVPRGGK